MASEGCGGGEEEGGAEATGAAVGGLTTWRAMVRGQQTETFKTHSCYTYNFRTTIIVRLCLGALIV